MTDAPNFGTVQPGGPDFGVAVEALVERLRERGLTPTPDGEKGWQTGLPGLRLEQGETMAIAVGEVRALAHVEMIASLDHPTWGRHLIADLVSLDGASPEAALIECVNLYVQMTLDPILALYDDELFASPAARLVTVVEPGEATAWNLYTRWAITGGQDEAVLAARLEETTLLGLVASTLCECLAKPGLHWCKLYGESQGAEPQFGCIFDGQRSREGEREMPARLELPPGGEWSYRAFMLFVPHGEPDPEAVERLRADLGPPPEGKRPWWRLGGPKRRMGWRVTEIL